MDAAAVLHGITRLASLKHQGTLTTDQFVILKEKAKKEGLDTDQVLENLSQASKLLCDGSVDKPKNEDDLRMIVKEIQPGRSDSGATEPVVYSQGSLVHVVAPRLVSKGEPEEARAHERPASPEYKK